MTVPTLYQRNIYLAVLISGCLVIGVLLYQEPLNLKVTDDTIVPSVNGTMVKQFGYRYAIFIGNRVTIMLSVTNIQ